jgi:glycosyltransferase involved in cell wall biosynthesis
MPSFPIHILMVTARFLPDLGGVETHTHEVSRRIAKHNDFNVTVLTTDPTGTRPVREQFEGFTVLRCRSYPQHRDYYFAPALYRLILSGQYDVIHCQGIHTAVPVLAMMAARRGCIPYIVTLHTGGHSSGMRHRLRNVQWRILGPLLRHAATVVAVSHFEHELFQHACHLDVERMAIIQNGGDLPTGTRLALPVPGRIVSCGRLERYKGHHRLIEALPIVRQSVPDATLHIVGTGPYEDKLRALSRTLGVAEAVAIEFIPPDERRRMADSLGQATLFAALSEYEAHPVAVMEALAMGIPVIGIDTAGIGDLVKDGLVTGVPRNASPAAIAQVLVTALNRRGATSAAAAPPTWDDTAAQIARIYTHVAGADRRPVFSHHG